jgi:hypothetical protein
MRFFALFGIRLIPLGRRQIVGHCSRCGWYQAWPLRDYLDRQRQDYALAPREPAG